MKLEKVYEEGIPTKELFEVTEITSDDITPPSENFLKFLREHKEFSFLNSFTFDYFDRKLIERFTSCGKKL
jgi:hypothetical protein